MAPINSSPKDFAVTCRQLYTEDEYGQANRYFSVLLLVADPLHFDASRSLRVGSNQKRAQQYFGRSRVIRKNVGGNTFIYTLEIKVIGARVSDLLQDNLQGLSLAAAVSTRDVIQTITRTGLTGACAGTIIRGLSDVSHLGTVLTTADEISSGENRGILHHISQVKGERPTTVAELAHSHGIQARPAGLLSQHLLKGSTALNPLTESATGEDVFIVHPQLNQEVVIVPMWDELQAEQGTQKTNDEISTTDAALASLALGTLATFGVEGMNQLTTQVVEPSNRGNHVPLSNMRLLKR